MVSGLRTGAPVFAIVPLGDACGVCTCVGDTVAVVVGLDDTELDGDDDAEVGGVVAGVLWQVQCGGLGGIGVSGVTGATGPTGPTGPTTTAEGGIGACGVTTACAACMATNSPAAASPSTTMNLRMPPSPRRRPAQRRPQLTTLITLGGFTGRIVQVYGM